MSDQHESGYNLEMKFCDLSLILWEQISFTTCKYQHWWNLYLKYRNMLVLNNVNVILRQEWTWPLCVFHVRWGWNLHAVLSLLRKHDVSKKRHSQVFNWWLMHPLTYMYNQHNILTVSFFTHIMFSQQTENSMQVSSPPDMKYT